MPKGRFLRSGKVKDIYEVDAGHLLFHFTDRVSAFDVVLPTTIPRKGEVLCKLGAYWFQTLGFPHHMVALEGADQMVVNRLDMVMVECVVRGYLYGSLYDRLVRGEVSLPIEKVLASKLAEPYFDPTTKSDVKDEPITEPEILKRGLMTKAEFVQARSETMAIYRKMTERADAAGFILADLKLEFGRDASGAIILADSIGPDEFRLWPKDSYKPGSTQESFDKQPVRDWLIATGYKKKLDEARKKDARPPAAPELPDELVKETSRRYEAVYKAFVGHSL